MIIGGLSWYFAIIYPQAKDSNTKEMTTAIRIMVSRLALSQLSWLLTNSGIFANI